jgi:hypothetical protein
MIANTTFLRNDSATEVFQTLTDFCEITLLERLQSGSTAYIYDDKTITEFRYEWILLTKKYDGTLSFQIIGEDYLWNDLENWSVAYIPTVALKGGV